MELTITEENYIKAIYKYGGSVQTISTNTLASEIKIKASSVTDMLKKLKIKKLISYKAYEGCKLTVQGEKIALGIIRKHRLWETFLCKTLGFDWNEVHVIAEELEHVGHPELINRLDAFLGFPETDPHGDAIPDANGKLHKMEVVPLSSLITGDTCIVCGVDSHEDGLLEILNHYQIQIGTLLEVITKFVYDESIEVKVNKKNVCVLPKAIVNNILIKVK